MHPNIAGALINSALYLTAVLWTAVVLGNKPAMLLAITAMGVTYLSHLAQLIPAIGREWCMAIVAASIGLGIAAGVSLLLF